MRAIGRGSGRTTSHTFIRASMPRSTARSGLFFSQSISSSAKVPGLRVAPELSDQVGPLEVREHQDVEQFDAEANRGPKAQRSCSHLLEGHDRTLVGQGGPSRWT